MKQFINWIRWCFICKDIMPWSVGLVSFDKLTKEEYEYPFDRMMETKNRYDKVLYFLDEKLNKFIDIRFISWGDTANHNNIVVVPDHSIFYDITDNLNLGELSDKIIEDMKSVIGEFNDKLVIVIESGISYDKYMLNFGYKYFD